MVFTKSISEGLAECLARGKHSYTSYCYFYYMVYTLLKLCFALWSNYNFVAFKAYILNQMSSFGSLKSLCP